MKKTIKQLFEGKGLTEREQTFLALYLCGWNMSEAYSIAFDSKAGAGLSAMASHLFSSIRIKDTAQLLARYVSDNEFRLPKKMMDLNK